MKKNGGTRKKTAAMSRQEAEYLLNEMKRLRTMMNRLARLEKYSLIDHPGRLLAFQFTMGIVRGLGALIGASIIVAMAAYIFGQFPAVKEFFDSISALSTLTE